MMDLLSRFREHIRQQDLFSPKDTLLLAVSGGVDSVVLCELCRQTGYDFTIAHCNFKLRGDESERDVRFVKQLGEKYGVEVLVKEFDTKNYAEEKKISVQEAARELRYAWFNTILEGKRQFLLTAHHADDNIETLLMNFSRGMGLHGLTGIPVKAGHIRRPLLSFLKEDLVGFAAENKLDFVEDSSNRSSIYTRNFFRNEIIPLIANAFPQVKENLLDNISRFREIEKLYKLSVGEIKKRLCKQKGSEIHIPVRQLMGFQNKALIYEIISDYDFTEKQVEEVIKLAASDSGRYISSPNNAFRIIRHRHWFIISPQQDNAVENIIIDETCKETHFALGTLQVEQLTTSNFKPQTSNFSACLDAKDIRFPLLLRKWKTGDYFYPLGMKKKKKLSRFFIDQKLSLPEKENSWVLEGDKKILWVVGHRIDERFKITDKTRSALQLTLKKKDE